MREMVVEIKDKEYVFTLNREIIKRGEKSGLNVRRLEDEPLSQVDMFWYVGLLVKQPNMLPKVATDLMRNYVEEGGDEKEIIAFLLEEYNTFFQTTQSTTEKKKPVIREV